MIYYATARQQVTTNDYVLVTLLPIVERILTQAGISHTASFLSNIADNSTALSTSLICPQCLATPFSFTKVDLIPFSNLQSTYTVTSLLIYVRCYLSLSFYILLLLPSDILASLHLFPCPNDLGVFALLHHFVLN
jgi:hypothetical protein